MKGRQRRLRGAPRAANRERELEAKIAGNDAVIAEIFEQCLQPNRLIPRDMWLGEGEKQAILDFHDKNPLEGYPPFVDKVMFLENQYTMNRHKLLNGKRCLYGMLIIMLSAIGCGSPPKANARIDIDTSFGLGPRYLQNGEGIHGAAMISMLEEEPETVSHIRTAKTMSYISTAFAAAGGALIGWPLGQSLSGERHPLWVLAGIGAGVFTLSIPFSVYEVYSVDNAVKAHNRGVVSAGLSWPGVTSSLKPPPPPPPKVANGKAPDGAAGFAFGSDIATAEAQCMGAGFVWQTLSEKQFSCSGTPTDVGMPGTAKLTTCEGTICKIAVKGSFDGVSWNELKGHFSKLSKLLEASYGPNTQGGTERLADCTDGIPQCLETGRVRKTMQWRWKNHHEVSLILSGGPVGGPPSLLLLYSNPAYAAENL